MLYGLGPLSPHSLKNGMQLFPSLVFWFLTLEFSKTRNQLSRFYQQGLGHISYDQDNGTQMLSVFLHVLSFIFSSLKVFLHYLNDNSKLGKSDSILSFLSESSSSLFFPLMWMKWTHIFLSYNIFPTIHLILILRFPNTILGGLWHFFFFSIFFFVMS